MSERPVKKKRPFEATDSSLVVSSGTSSLLNLNPSSTNLTVLHQQHQIESLQAELDHERAARELDMKKYNQAIHRLEKKINLITSDANDAKELYDDTIQQNEKRIQQLTESRDRAIRLNRQLQLEIEQREQEAAASTDAEHYRDKCERLQDEIRALVDNESSYKDEIQNLKADVESKLKQIQNLATSPVKENKFVENAPEAVMRELNRCRVLLAENERQCRQLQHEKDDLLQEKYQLTCDCEKYQLQTKRLPIITTQLEKITRSYEQIQAEINVWNEFSDKINTVLKDQFANASSKSHGGNNGPPEVATIVRFFETANKERQEAKLAVSKLQTKCDNLKKELDTAQSIANTQNESSMQWNTKQREYEVKLDTVSRQLDLAKQQVKLYQREADGLRELIKTFERQDPRSGSNKIIDPISESFQIKLRTIQEEKEVLQTKCNDLLSELGATKTEKGKMASELDRVRDKFGKLKDALMLEREKVAEAEERAVNAEQLAGKGSFDPSRTRVLHFSNNPLVMALKEEVQVLKRQVETLTKSNASVAGSNSNSIKTGIVANPDKLNQRLKENFKEQIALFREGVYLMTGYKVDMLTNQERPTFRLRSVFAEQEDDQLLFQWPKTTTKGSNDNNEVTSSLDLLNTDLAKQLATTPSYDYMTKFNSLPAFLASVQLSLFEKQTIVIL